MISDEKFQKAIGFKPHPNQATVLACNEREMYIAAGRRFGKSAVCAYIALKTLLEPNKRVWIVAPTYDLTAKVFDYVVKWFAKVTPSGAGGISYRPYPRIRLPNGSILECRSTDSPSSLLGEEVDLEIIDEAARIPEYIYSQYLYPVTSSRKGRIIGISTPFGKNWFYKNWIKAKENNAAFQFSSRDGVSVDQSEWELAKSKLPEQIFKQEYEAQFLDDAASVFRGLTAITLPPAECLEDAIGSHTYVMGVDLAKVNDFTVLTVIDTYSHKVVALDRFNQLDYNLQKGRIKAMAYRYNNARIIIDSTGVGNPISEDLRREALYIDDFKFSNKSKQELIEKLSLFIEQKGVLIPDNMTLLDELSSYGYQMTGAGNFKYGAPDGGHDDMVISLGLAVWGIDSPKKDDLNFINFRRKKTVHAKPFQFF